MPRDRRVSVFVGIKNSVVALDDRTGEEIWRAQLGSTTDYVTVLWDGEALVVANSGEVWRLDPESGQALWHNKLKGLGRGIVSLASSRRAADASDTGLAAAKRRSDAQHAAMAAAT